ncbi:SusC/RagA family TonB-linked outer membrane protein [Puteibacter caeruleilacunae]|nr:SusC/RagA family TonB-linked outer membrane protein [Puteibacter caeruleilacunae]
MKNIVFILVMSTLIVLFDSVLAKEAVGQDSLTNVEVSTNINRDVKYTGIDFSTVDREALSNATKLDVMEALFAKIPGLNVTQGNGFSFERSPKFSLHGLTPLVLVDGVPRSLSNLIIDEVEDVVVYNDAVAAAIYGVAGARGVINIITKKGRNQPKLEMQGSYQGGIATKFRTPDFTDAYTYARALNTAMISDGMSERYSALELEAFQKGTYPDVYADVDWYNEVFSNTEVNHQFNFNVRGGKEKFDYYALIAYSRNEGLFKYFDKDDRYKNQLLDTRLTLRTNFRVDVTKSTEFRANLQAQMKEFNGPNALNNILTSAYKTPSAAFPIKSDGIWGGNSTYKDNNPVALLSSNGHYKTMVNSLNLDINLRQNLDAITEGLSASAFLAIDNSGSLNESSNLKYEYVDLNPTILSDGTVITDPVVYGTNSQFLGHGSGIETTYFNTFFTSTVNYKKSFGKNDLDLSLIYNMQSNKVTGRNKSRLRQSVTGYFSNNYNNKYFLDAVVTYAGASAIQLGDRFSIYPAVSGGWLVTEEDFFKSGIIDYLKVKGSFGYSAWDRSIPYDLEKVYYTSGKAGYVATGTTGAPINKGGWGESDLPTTNLELEKMRKTTFGIDMKMLDSKLSLSADAFFNKRYDVLISTNNTSSSVLGLSAKNQNDGIYKYKGFDLALGWKDKKGDFSYELGAVLSFVQSEIVNNNEGFKPYDYLYRKGNSTSQVYGLEADGFFNNQADIDNAPVHTFYTVQPGDIKYKDQNGDDVIDANDVVKLMNPSVPEIYYGFDVNLKYKNISLRANFQGVGKHSVSLLNSTLYKPLVNHNTISDTFLDNEVFWTEENSAVATMPRLTTLSNANNYRASSHWYRNASYLKLRDLKLAYSVEHLGGFLPFAEIYVAGSNLFSIDDIDFADPESIGDNYPSLRSYWAGIKVKF